MGKSDLEMKGADQSNNFCQHPQLEYQKFMLESRVVAPSFAPMRPFIIFLSSALTATAIVSTTRTHTYPSRKAQNDNTMNRSQGVTNPFLLIPGCEVSCDEKIEPQYKF